jgi:hypothetical protein
MAKNVKNPLFTALTLSPAGPEGSPLPAPRLFDFKKEEVGEDVLPGDVLEMEVSGVVKSVDDQGRITVNITRAENCEAEDKNSSQQPIYVKTQESHVP